MEISKEKQRLLIEFLLKDHDSFTKCLKIVKPKYFDGIYKNVVSFIIDFSSKYHSLPTDEVLYSEFSNLEKIDLSKEKIVKQREYFLKELEKFCKTKALMHSILESSEKIEKGIFEGIEQSIKDALSVKFDFDIGLNYFESPKERIEKLLNNNNTISTGWNTIDKVLYGGLNRGEITIFAGNSGEGKSLFLQNIAVNWILGPKINKKISKGLNVVYYTLELSDLLVASRIDAMILKKSTKENFRNAEAVDMFLKNLKKDSNVGNLDIKVLPAGANINDLRSHLKEYEIQRGYLPDAIIVDYLDLMYPSNKKVDPSDLFIKDKFVSEEVRGLAVEKNILCVTASQLNRSAIDADEHEMSHIAGGISKINTADNVITIKRLTKDEKYKIKFIKTRSSSGVGKEIIMDYDPLCMRIDDSPDYDEEDHEERNSPLIKKFVLKETYNRNSEKTNNTIMEKNINSNDENGIEEEVQNVVNAKDFEKEIENMIENKEIKQKSDKKTIDKKNTLYSKNISNINSLEENETSLKNILKKIDFL